MNKLTLNADTLRVESFSTQKAQEQVGTVLAHMVSAGANTCYCTSKNIGCWCTEQC